MLVGVTGAFLLGITWTISLDRGSNPLPAPKLNIMSRTIKKARKAVSKSCRNNGGCPVCESNRLHKHNKKIEQSSYSLNTIKK